MSVFVKRSSKRLPWLHFSIPHILPQMLMSANADGDVSAWYLFRTCALNIYASHDWRVWSFRLKFWQVKCLEHYRIWLYIYSEWPNNIFWSISFCFQSSLDNRCVDRLQRASSSLIYACFLRTWLLEHCSICQSLFGSLSLPIICLYASVATAVILMFLYQVVVS